MTTTRATTKRLHIPGALTVALIASCSPPAPVADAGDAATTDGASVDGAMSCAPWNPGAIAPPPAMVRPMIDIAPCAMSMPGPGTSICHTAANCDVFYDTPAGAENQATFVSCPVRDNRCLVSFDATGAAVYATCPTLELAGATCMNNTSLQLITSSNFSCSANETCTVEGTPGGRSSFVQRFVDGMLSRSPCPAQCGPLA